MKKLLFASLFALASFSVYSQDAQPDETNAMLKVTVLDQDNKPIPNEKIIIQSDKTQKVYSGISDGSGKFQLLLPNGCSYSVKIDELAAAKEYKKLNVPPTGYLNFNYTIRIDTRIETKTYTLNNVFFDTGKSILKPESDKELDKLAEYLGYKKTTVIEIGGYTDNVGKDDDNQKLSQARAEAVKNYLVHKGIGADRLQAKGYGASNPVATNDTPEGRQQNRRTEVHILKD
jgi:outer membrane protein OmpA-like peptidoglycan-associated protein